MRARFNYTYIEDGKEKKGHTTIKIGGLFLDYFIELQGIREDQSVKRTMDIKSIFSRIPSPDMIYQELKRLCHER